jgi:acyl-CoA synthetase (NDP forming)
VLARALVAGGGWLDAGALRELASAYGLPTLEPVPVASAAEAARVAASMPGAVALKAVAPGLLHKTDAGGVAVGLRGAAAVRRAAARMRTDVAAAGFTVTGFLVQPMAGEGVEMHVGVTTDGLVGPLVACAAGGVSAELIDDISVRIAPLERDDPAEMVRELATFPLLDGYRGAPRADVGALEGVLRRIGALAADHPAIAELDCNPVIVGPQGAAIVDMRVRVAEAEGSSGRLPGTRPGAPAPSGG